MESVQRKRQVTAEEVATFATTGAKSALGRGRRFLRALWRLIGMAVMVALVTFAVRAEMWLFATESNLLAVGGLFFYGYVLLTGAFGVYFLFFTSRNKDARPALDS